MFQGTIAGDRAIIAINPPQKTVVAEAVGSSKKRDDSHALLNFWFAWCTNIEKALSIFLKPKAGSTRWK